MPNIVHAISVALVLLSCALTVDAGAVELQKYCTTLKQSQDDTNQCFEKPRQYTVDGDPFILAYMCCFGYFNDVTYNYMPYMDDSFVQWFITLTSEDTLQKIAEFLLMCGKDSNVLTESDYNYWASHDGKANFCKA